MSISNWIPGDVVAWLTGVSLLCATGLSSANDVPRFPDAAYQSISSDMVQNGRQLSIESLATSRTVDEVVAWYQSQWPRSDEDPGHVLSDIDGWQVISRVQNGINIAVQLRTTAGGGSEGLVSTMTLNGHAAPDVPVPPGAEVFSVSENSDAFRDSQTAVVIGAPDSESTLDFYREFYDRHRWERVVDSKTGDSHVLMFNRKGEQCELVVSMAPDGSTIIFWNRSSTRHG